MILDSSAVVAILNGEPEAERFSHLITHAPGVSIAAPTLLELFIVADSAREPRVRSAVDAVLSRIDARVVPFTAEHAALARGAYRDYGRGSGHPARLNFGDCITYAVAKATDEPLLYKGDDFRLTDIRSALA